MSESGQGVGSTLPGILGKGTGRFRRSLVLGSLLVSSAASFKPVQTSPVQTSGALLEMYSSSIQRCLVPLRTSLSVESRRFFSSAEFRTGRYAKVTEDVVFKHIMHKENLRNSFLGAVVGQPVLHSKILDTSLNPIKEFESLRKVINRKGIEDLMKKISSGKSKPKITNITTKRPLHGLEAFVGELALHYHQLLHAIPGAERNTQLDVVCETKDGLFNIEVQVEPQNFWDIRILSHVCGLFQRQFPRSFGWSELENDPGISKKVRRAVGVSIFEKAPVHQSDVHELLPWYDSKPWAKDELRRHFQLTDQNNKELRRPGIEFFDFNLQAVSSQNPSLLQQPTELQEWLDFLAKAHRKQPEEIESLKTTELKEAYQMAEINSWDEKLKAEYREQQAKRYNISHYVEGEKKQAGEKARKEEKLKSALKVIEARKEEKLQTALRLMDMGLTDEDVLKVTLFSPEQLEEIKRNNNK